jgi:hypothetical protein
MPDEHLCGPHRLGPGGAPSKPIVEQRELLTRLRDISFHGVPALPCKKEVRAALERAWFEQRPLRITTSTATSSRASPPSGCWPWPWIAFVALRLARPEGGVRV